MAYIPTGGSTGYKNPYDKFFYKDGTRDKKAGQGYSPFGSAAVGGAALGGLVGGLAAAPPEPVDPDAEALRTLQEAGWTGGSTGFGDGGGEPAEVPDPLSNPEYLAMLGQVDAGEATAIGGYRARQDAARRALSDLLGDIAEREVKSSGRTKESQEGRGLLRSGATERLLAEVSSLANSDRARGRSTTADQISDFERGIAEAKANAAKERANLKLKYGATGLVI